MKCRGIRAGFFTSGTWLEGYFSAMETFSADSDDVSVWKHVGLLLANFRSQLELCVVILTNVAQLLYDVPSEQSPSLRRQ